MRKLNNQQKNLLSSYVYERYNSDDALRKSFDWEYVPIRLQDKILDINDYETLVQDANRFMHDEFNHIAFCRANVDSSYGM